MRKSLSIVIILQVICIVCGSDNRTVLVASGEIVFRVRNGKEARPGDIPWQVGLMKKMGKPYKVFCGGSIVTPTKIVSAAHCLHPPQRGSFCIQGKMTANELKHIMVVAGHMSSTIEKPFPDSDQGQWRSIKSATYPPQFKFPKLDISVLIISSPFKTNKLIHPIPLASRRLEYTIKCIISGYGLKSYYEPAYKLMYAEVMTIHTQTCNELHGQDMSHYVCTSDTVSDIRQGDGGGPLVCKGVDPADKGEGVLVGVVSGKVVGMGPNRTFFTRVTNYKTFIAVSRAFCIQYSKASLIVIYITLSMWAPF